MAVDKKISQLASGAPAQAGDEYVVARSGANFKLTLTNIAASMPPIGATTPNTGAFTTLSASSGETISGGNLTFSGTAQRITGDFSSSNPVYFQSSTTDGGTSIGAIPNGTGTSAFVNLLASSSGTNCNRASLQIYNGSEMSLRSVGNGTFTFVPMTFYTGGSERVRIDTSGNVGIGATNIPYKFVAANSGTDGAWLYSSSAISYLGLGGYANGGDGAFQIIYNRGTGGITFNGGSRDTPAARMAIDNSGNVGIGTASPATKLTVSSATNAGLLVTDGTVNTIVYNSTGGVASIGTTSNHPVDFYSNNAARMRIDSSGNVGIGGTAPAYVKFYLSGTYPTSINVTQVVRADGTIPSGSTSSASIFQSVPTTQAASFTLPSLSHFNATQTSFGAGSTVTSQYGFVAESTLTGATNNYGFYSAIASGSNRWNFYAAGTAQNYFAGNTRTDGTLLAASAQTWDERLGAYRTENQVVIGGYANNGSYTSSVIRVQVERASSNAFYFLEARVSGGTLRYGILGDGTVTTSDERRKKNITSVNDGLLSNLCKLRVVNYNWKTDSDADEKKIGLIAQEVEQVFPELVMVRYDGPNDDQEVKVLKTDSLVPMLIKAIQEQQAMIDELKAKVAALETK